MTKVEAAIEAAKVQHRQREERHADQEKRLAGPLRVLKEATEKVTTLGASLRQIEGEWRTASFEDHRTGSNTAGEKLQALRACQKSLKEAKEALAEAERVVMGMNAVVGAQHGRRDPLRDIFAANYEELLTEVAGDLRSRLLESFAVYCLSHGELQPFNRFAEGFLALQVVDTGHTDIGTKSEVLVIMDRLRQEMQAKVAA